MAMAIGMIETRGLVALVQATDAMLKAANVRVQGLAQGGQRPVHRCSWPGDVAAVKAARRRRRAGRPGRSARW